MKNQFLNSFRIASELVEKFVMLLDKTWKLQVPDP